jgi:subtilisin family serine protease
MKKLYKLHLRTARSVSALICFTFLALLSYGQKGPAVEEGLVRIRFTEAMASRLEQTQLSRTQDGIMLTGISELDAFNQQYKVREFKRVFRPAGKFEARHRQHGLHLWYQLKIESSAPVFQAVSSYQSLIQVEKAEPVYKKTIEGSENRNFGPVRVKEKTISSLPALPGGSNDPMLSAQWHYLNTGQTGGTAGADIKLIEAWKKETGKQEIIVAVTDGGIDTRHPDLMENLWTNPGEVANNGIDDDNNGFVDDIHGYSFVEETGSIEPDDHGTHVAGTIAAVTNNGIGVAGVAGGSGTGDGVRLMSCAVFSYWSAGGFAESYIYAADHGAVISQNSWTYTSPGDYEQAVLDAIDYFIEEAGKDENGNQVGPMKGGLVVFAAANNSSEDSYYPSYYAPTFSVAGTNHNDNKSWYSNYGSHVDISAPGGETDNVEEEGVLSTLAWEQYGYFQGTSMACPHVSGAAALVLAKYGRNGFTPAMVRERLRSTATPLTAVDPPYLGKMGSGRLDANAALLDNDNTAPSAITDLSIIESKIGKETLSWTAPSDAGGFVASYDIRYSTSPITAANFASATAAQNPSSPKSPGSTETFTVTGLAGGTLFYFAIKAADFHGNASDISNVISKTSEHAPVIVVSPELVTESLQTAQTSTRTFTISNTGPGPLEFFLQNAASENDFATALPHQGNLAPEGSQVITVTFDASNKFAGTYTKDLRIASNDPIKPMMIVPLTLQITNNNAPIASVQPENIHFKSVQTGTFSSRKISLHNAGSNPLVVDLVVSDNSDFTTNFSGSLTVPPFGNNTMNILFTPSSTGLKQGTVTLHTNDEAHPTLTVNVEGEGLNVAPIAITPSSIEEELERGTSVVKTLLLKNNGSFDREFRIEIQNNGPEAGSTAISQTPVDASKLPAARTKSTPGNYQAKIQPDPTRLGKDLFPLVGPKRSSSSREAVSGRQKSAVTPAATGPDRYTTGFENFETGSINEQENWYADEGWNVDNSNPNRGEKNLRGNATSPGQTTIAISPYLFDDAPYESMFTTVSMRINLDSSSGSSFEIVPQDYWSYVATRIRIHEDRTIEVMSIDQDYESVWTTLDVTIPSGYFDLAVEHNGFGDPESGSGFPVFDVYLDNKKVFHGYSLAPYITQTAFICDANTLERFLDIDDFDLRVGEYTPISIAASPLTGIIPAGSAAEVALNIDATDMKYGVYNSDIITRIDETDEVIVPAKVTVTGPGSISLSTYHLQGFGDPNELITMDLRITNNGGKAFDYTLSHTMASLSPNATSGTVAIRATEFLVFEFNPNETGPGLFYDTVKITTTLEEYPLIRIPVSVTVWETQGELSVPSEFRMDVPRGQIATKTFQLRNTGQNFVSYRIQENNVVLSFDPITGKIGNDTEEVIVTLDAREQLEGEYNWNFVILSNDPDHYYTNANLNVQILPPTANGSGKIDKEEWTGVPGSTVASIPVNTPPSSVTQITELAGAYGRGDNYGVRIRGYIQAPLNGYYKFFVASDDHSEVWVSTDMNPANKVKVCYLTSYVDPGQLTKYPSQISAPIMMQQDQKYYIEVLHKEGTGRDHLSVGWERPNGHDEFPIPGHRLFPLDFVDPSNNVPAITITSPYEGEIFGSPASITIEANASDTDGTIVKVEFYNGNDKIGTDYSAPYSFLWNTAEEGNHTLIAKAFDDFGETDSATVNITVGVEPCSGTGALLREVWTGIPGKLVSSIPVNTPPSSSGMISSFVSPYNIGDNYGSRVRGYVCVPASGSYTFWIASDDHSELWLSTDEDPANKVKIASVTGYTLRSQWDKYPSQKSVTISLQAGHKYYIEALQKEAAGADHLSVGWQLPDGSMERPIGGNRLIPFNESNTLPSITLTSPFEGQQFTTADDIIITAEASDTDGTIAKVEYYVGVYKIGEDFSVPYSFTWDNGDAGNFTIIAKAIDNDGGVASDSVDIAVTFTCGQLGSINWDIWYGIPGTSVSAVPVNQPPNGTSELTTFETPQYFANDYAARIRGYLCVPQTGDYTFWIASDDNSELWLSLNDDQGNKVRIANVPGHTNPRQWTKYPSQRSAPVHLIGGYRYYIEALHKEANGNDHIAVGWQLPDGTSEMPIPGNRLSRSIDENADAAREKEQNTLSVAPEEGGDLTNGLSLFPNPATKGTVTLSFDNEGDQALPTGARIEISSTTGKVVYSQDVTCNGTCDAITFDIDSRFAPGAYVVNAVINGKRFTRKLMIY